MESLASRTELRSEDEVRAALRRAVRRADVDALLVVRRGARLAVDDRHAAEPRQARRASQQDNLRLYTVSIRQFWTL